MPDKSPHALLVMALKNTHAMTAESKQVVDRQLDRFEQYAEVKSFLQTRSQTLGAQAERIETVLATLGEKSSGFKELVTSIVGNAAMIGHAATGDEVLKDYFVDTAFAGMGVACYESLFIIAEAAGEAQTVGALQASFEEEKQAYDWLNSHVAPVSRHYVELTAAGARSSH
jgi:ferritin-like metal-binding protein YciE